MWQLASLAKTEARRLRPMMITFLVAYVVIAINSNLHFFVAPVVVEILIALCFVFAIATTKSQAAA